MKNKLFYSLFILMATLSKSFSQDILVLTNKDSISVKIIEVTPKQVKYKMFDNQDGPTINTNKTKIISIIFENGVTQKISNIKQNDLYAEIGGSSFLGLNYERQLSSTPGVGVRAGMSWLWFNWYGIIGINYISTGNRSKKSFVDVGLSAAFLASSDRYLHEPGEDSTFLIPNIGYRKHTKYGIMWRINMAAWYNIDGGSFRFPGFSLGVHF
jgi:hypothetical protein